MIAKAIFLTLLALAILGGLGWSIFRAGWWAGRRKMRQQLGIAGQRRIKTQELLAHEAHELLASLQHPMGSLDEVSYLSDTHAAAVDRWQKTYLERVK